MEEDIQFKWLNIYSTIIMCITGSISVFILELFSTVTSFLDLSILPGVGEYFVFFSFVGLLGLFTIWKMHTIIPQCTVCFQKQNAYSKCRCPSCWKFEGNVQTKIYILVQHVMCEVRGLLHLLVLFQFHIEYQNSSIVSVWSLWVFPLLTKVIQNLV